MIIRIAHTFFSAALLLFVVSVAAHAEGQKSHIMVSSSWVASAPPTAKMHAAFFNIMNHGKEKRAFVSVSSPQYAKAEIHVSKVENGIAMMQQLAQVEIAPGASVQFKPHGLHVMLMRPKGTFKLGDKIGLNLMMDDGQSISVSAIVKPRAKAKTETHMHHHKGHHTGM